MTMKTMMRGVVACLAAASMAALAGCGSGTGNAGGDSAKSTTAAVKKLDLSKIEYSVESTPIDGKRQLAMSYTNDTGFAIASVQVAYRQKSDVTEEQKTAAFAELRKGGMDDDGYSSSKDLPLKCTSDRLVESGGTVENQGCDVGGWKAVGDFLPIMEPDVMTVVYFKSANKIGQATYDLVNRKTTIDSEVKDAVNWKDDALTRTLPKPKSKLVIDNYAHKTAVSYDAYGISRDQFKQYIEACKEKGFTEDSSYDTSAYLNGESGSRLSLNYDADEQSMSIQLTAKQ
ncbi:hypothetical protein GFD17_09065 [Bifidobacterium sp. SMB2]|uniref:DUF6591 domain-containing protein n=1 Tax=Bifidobacterium saimiriisciurei TaxID=2661627 RepID=A0ABX0CF89_9BIFI|nr:MULTISPECIES: DUF6591 domain-containing protein [Bifidobacterium]NEG96896.1 hypothetical protein [Bifidobacterium sp. SMB2]NEH11574.1 hypothetical protein [Bifidobacterium saimiriisciurei]